MFEDGSWKRGRGAFLVLLLSLVPAAVLWILMTGTWGNIPYWDDWATPGKQLYELSLGRLNFWSLISQHNESRPFFPRLVFLPVHWFLGWDPRIVSVLIFGMAFGSFFLLHRRILKLPGIRPVSAVALQTLVGFMIFWPSESWTFENTFIMFWPPLLLLLAVTVNLSRLAFPTKVISNALFATIATFSWSNGLLLWPLSFPLQGAAFEWRAFSTKEEKKELRWYLFYVAAFCGNLALFFHDYKGSKLSWHIPYILDYFFTWFGAPFQDREAAKRIGECVVAAFAALASGCLYSAWKKRDFSAAYPWVIVGGYALISGWIAAMGRARFGVEQAFSPRYIGVSCYMYISLTGLAWLTWNEVRLTAWGRRSVKPALFMAGMAAGFFLPFVARGYGLSMGIMRELGEDRRAVLSVWQWSLAFPGNAALKQLYPDPSLVMRVGNELEKRHVLKIQRFPKELIEGWKLHGEGDIANGNFDKCEITGKDELSVVGWARKPDGTPADYVLFTAAGEDGAERLYGIMAAAMRRPDVADVLKSHVLLKSGFRQKLAMETLPSGKVTLRAWAVDMKNSRVSPMAGTFVIDHALK